MTANIRGYMWVNKHETQKITWRGYTTTYLRLRVRSVRLMSRVKTIGTRRNCKPAGVRV